jgi:AcrR family transcriptional regulator
VVPTPGRPNLAIGAIPVASPAMSERLRTAPRQARSAESVDLILDTAERLFHERGVANVSTVDIAHAAGISVGRLYYWYPDKDAVVFAVLERAERLVFELLTEVMVDDPDVPTPDLLGHIISALAVFLRRHPGTLAVIQQQPSANDQADQGLYRTFVDLAASIVFQRVPGIPADELDLVAVTCVRVAMTMLDEYLRSDDERAEAALQEVHYVLAAYLYARYPDNVDAVWDKPNHTIRPARHPRSSGGDATPVFPGYSTHPRTET